MSGLVYTKEALLLARVRIRALSMVVHVKTGNAGKRFSFLKIGKYAWKVKSQHA